ncbi:uncharacterized protein LOC143565759 [Bidens hawaiensis]|uniref:uncharacterized protein LOC143565759 n=1 Tax=Bidens hawaiensis TaxID=980011 RepID=UPI00404A83CF
MDLFRKKNKKQRDASNKVTTTLAQYIKQNKANSQSKTHGPPTKGRKKVVWKERQAREPGVLFQKREAKKKQLMGIALAYDKAIRVLYLNLVVLNFPNSQLDNDYSVMMANLNPASSCDSTSTCSHYEGGATHDFKPSREKIQVKHVSEIVAKERPSEEINNSCFLFYDNKDSGYYIGDQIFDMEFSGAAKDNIETGFSGLVTRFL